MFEKNVSTKICVQFEPGWTKDGTEIRGFKEKNDNLPDWSKEYFAGKGSFSCRVAPKKIK
jgi:hypothetical protein